MKSTVSGKTVKSILRQRLNEDSSILKDVGQLTKFASCVAIGHPITIGVAVADIFKTAGSCISLGQKVLDKFRSEDPELRKLSQYDNEKFDIVFYVLCQKSYFEAIEHVFKKKNLKQWATNKSSTQKIDQQIFQRLERIINKAEYSEVHYLLSINPTSINIPLYNLYSEWLTCIFELFNALQESGGIVQEIKQKATKNFHLKISEDTPISKWIRNYLLISQHIDSEINITDHLSSIEKLLTNWIDTGIDVHVKRLEFWKEYRERLQSLPDDKDSMFNESFGVRKVFVCPEVEYYRQGFMQESAKQKRDLSTIIGGLLSKRTSNEDLIFLCGGPGSGKSTICRLLCDQLSRNEMIHPVLLKLRSLDDCKNITGFIENNLKQEGLIDELKDLRDLKNVVIILDGFDEVVMANREKLRGLFLSLKDELRRYSFRKTKILIAGRDTLFPDGDGIPGRSHILELKPFNRLRIKKWGEKWNNAPHNRNVSKSFIPEIHVDSATVSNKNAINHLVSWPLTLHLLARIHASGLIDLSSAINIDKAFIYKCIIYDTAIRQKEKKRDEDDIGRLEPDRLHSFLMDIAWQMHIDGKDIIEAESVQKILDCYGLNQSKEALRKVSETAVLNAPTLKKGDDRGIEFVHKSFAEYLSAETVAKKIDEIHHKVSSEYVGTDYKINTNEVVRILVDIFCKRPITDEILSFVLPMIGTYREYKSYQKYDNEYVENDHLDRLRDLIHRLEDRYCYAVLGKDLPEINRHLVNEKVEFNLLYVQSLYVAGLLKILGILYKKFKQDRFYLFHGFDNPARLEAILMLSNNSISDIISKSDYWCVTSYRKEILVDGKFKRTPEDIIEAIANEKHWILDDDHKIDDSIYISGYSPMAKMTIANYLNFQLRDILNHFPYGGRSELNTQNQELKEQSNELEISLYEIKELILKIYKIVKLNESPKKMQNWIMDQWRPMPHYVHDLENTASNIVRMSKQWNLDGETAKEIQKLADNIMQVVSTIVLDLSLEGPFLET